MGGTDGHDAGLPYASVLVTGGAGFISSHLVDSLRTIFGDQATEPATR
jgi:hypothetical protein